jgi:hypothetical protein
MLIFITGIFYISWDDHVIFFFCYLIECVFYLFNLQFFFFFAYDFLVLSLNDGIEVLHVPFLFLCFVPFFFIWLLLIHLLWSQAFISFLHFDPLYWREFIQSLYITYWALHFEIFSLNLLHDFCISVEFLFHILHSFPSLVSYSCNV